MKEGVDSPKSADRMHLAADYKEIFPAVDEAQTKTKKSPTRQHKINSKQVVKMLTEALATPQTDGKEDRQWEAKKNILALIGSAAKKLKTKTKAVQTRKVEVKAKAGKKAASPKGAQKKTAKPASAPAKPPRQAAPPRKPRAPPKYLPAEYAGMKKAKMPLMFTPTDQPRRRNPPARTNLSLFRPAESAPSWQRGKNLAVVYTRDRQKRIEEKQAARLAQRAKRGSANKSGNCSGNTYRAIKATSISDANKKEVRSKKKERNEVVEVISRMKKLKAKAKSAPAVTDQNKIKPLVNAPSVSNKRQMAQQKKLTEQKLKHRARTAY